jgi:flagellar biosynthesis protein FlhB
MVQAPVQKPNVAVALQYVSGKDAVPRIVAKGLGDVAAKIRELADSSGVHIEVNDPLARSLAQIEVEQQIPKELYRAIAEIISFVLKKSGRLKE